MREGVGKGFVQPRVLMERVLPQCEPLSVDDPKKNIFFQPLQSLPENRSAAEKDKLSSEYREAVRQFILPAYRRLHDFIKDEYLSHCRATAGLVALPGGKEAYAHNIRLLTTLNRSPDEIHEIGLREVARIKTEMEKVRAETGFKGTLPELLNYAATDPRFAPFTTHDEVLAEYRKIEGRLTAQSAHKLRHLRPAK